MRDKGIMENFFRRDGRLNRLRYFKRVLVINLIMIIIFTAIFIFSPGSSLDDISPAENMWLNIIDLILFVPWFCLMTRRLHDMNKNETLAWVVVALEVLTLNSSLSDPLFAVENIPDLIQLLILFYMFLIPGTKGRNKYGADPLGQH